MTVKLLGALVLGSLVVATAAGCGANPAPAPTLRSARVASILDQRPATYEAVGVPQPVKQASGLAYQQAVVSSEVAPAQRLTATVASTRNGLVLGLGTFNARIMVANPTGTRLSGDLVVTFLKNGKPVSGPPIRQPVTLEPGDSDTLEFTDRRWSTDGVQATFADEEASGTV